MLAIVGRPLAELHRVAFAGLTLGDLTPGTSRDLTAEEVNQLYALPPMLTLK